MSEFEHNLMDVVALATLNRLFLETDSQVSSTSAIIFAIRPMPFYLYVLFTLFLLFQSHMSLARTRTLMMDLQTGHFRCCYQI